MASVQVTCLSLFLLFLHIQAQSENIHLGSSLTSNTRYSSWSSPLGHFAFGFYQQGNGFAVGIWLAGEPNITVVWTANRDDPPVSVNSTIEFTKDGLLLRTGHDEKAVVDLSDELVADEVGFSASMLDSGNFVIYNNETKVIWESFKNPTDTILGGQSINTQLNASISSSDHSSGRFYLEVNRDGVAAYPVNHTGVPEENYWKIKPSSPISNLRLNLSLSGVLKLTSTNETLQVIANSSYSSNSTAVIYRATLDADGILRLYSHHFEITGNSTVTTEWSAMQKQCEVIGFCGFNSFCSSTSGRADCYCFPGFDFINPDMTNLGCYKTFNDEEGCERKDPAVFYNITDVEKTKLGGFPYSLQHVNKEDCRESCLKDCYCAAALYLNKTCGKLRLPLMFGMEDGNISAMVFIKKISGNTEVPSNPQIPENHDIFVSESKKTLITILASSLGFMAFLCFLIAISSFFVYKHRVDRYRKLSKNPNLGLTQEFSLQSFSYNELEQATEGFKEELGRGHLGAVYKGTISEGSKIVAVKRFKSVGEEEEKKFRAEMTAVRRTHHRNLVRLLGFCMERSRKLLVYEYMSNGSLEDFLFNVERRPLWKERVRIALDVARGILYIHEECEIQIVHCDIKPSNILMDDSWTAKISNFGLAKLSMPNQSVTDLSAQGSRGYMAPEWQKNGLITVKSDVYSFGVVLLEIVCCRSYMEVNVSTADEVLLANWVYNCFIAGELDKLVAEEEVNMKTLERMVKVGLLCIQDDPKLRPSMKNVILMLEGTMDIPIPPFPTPLVIT